MTSQRTSPATDQKRSIAVAILIVAALLASACSSTTLATTTGTTPATTSTTPQTSEPSDVVAPTSTSTTILQATDVPTFVDENGFNDHSVPRIETVADYFALARSGVSNQSVVKFSVPDLVGGSAVHWMDSNFFTLHDEWYWFRILNGKRVPEVNVKPFDGPGFNTIAEGYQWVEASFPSVLPAGLVWVNGRADGKRRLYAPNFYKVALDAEPREYGVGSLVHYPARAADSAEYWVIELEYSDDASPTDIAHFFSRLAATLPESIASNLSWVVRSPVQERTATTMIEQSLEYGDRIVHYGDLVPSGEVAVYNEGIAAGRLLYIGDDGADISQAKDRDILLVETVPDWLPPASALISSAPQTPLSHVNLLARNRGIPNASQSGILDDAGIRQAARVRAPAIVRASGTGELEVILISEREYARWVELGAEESIAVPQVNTDSMPYTVNLTELARSIRSDDDLDEWRPVIGGKSAGMLTLLEAAGVTTPPSPTAITVRAYLEHLFLIKDEVAAILEDDDFEDHARARYLLLEGLEQYGDFYGTDDDPKFSAAEFMNDNPPGTLLGDIIEAGGFMNVLRDKAIRPAALDEITAMLEETYGDYSQTQGLRFRSSSSVEDIEGFNGAGLYDSNTGFLNPSAQEEAKDKKKSVERALKKTWASYWSFEAFEERRRERVDHLSGAMAVLVHARFDDPLELSNGVATFTLSPDGAPGTLSYPESAVSIARINVQAGDVSVANPDPGAGLPEIIEVTLRLGQPASINRIAESTIADHQKVLEDVAVLELVSQIEAATLLWRERINRSLPFSQEIATVTLDFEFKMMAEGWPAATNGSDQAKRLVVKQARSLDPGVRGIPQAVLDLPVSRQIIARARLVSRI
ncbi:MAG: PEP/pyruvate-binding domain-containing protein, partial [Acidimicrobiales bacterium]